MSEQRKLKRKRYGRKEALSLFFFGFFFERSTRNLRKEKKTERNRYKNGKKMR